MNNNQNDIDELITRSLAGESSAEDEQRLKAWIALSKENDRYYQKLSRAMALADRHYQTQSLVPEVNIDAEWNQFLGTIGKKEKNNVRTLAPGGWWLRIAAAVFLIVTSGVIYNYFSKADDWIIVETAAITKDITLPDGSQITLNQNSSLSYQKSFNKTDRKVKLQGEAFFEVAHNPSKPFSISINSATVEVLGTSFNVRSDNSTEIVEVVVASGAVKLSGPDKAGQVQLRAGDVGVYSRSQNILTNRVNTDENFIAWKTRKLTFKETNLRLVVETLEKAYNVQIVISTTVPDTCLVTVSFDQQDLNAVLNVLKTTLNLEYKTQNGKIEIIHAGC